MDPTTSTPVVDLFRQYARLYQLRNHSCGKLAPTDDKEWKELTVTLDSIFSGIYRPNSDEIETKPATRAALLRDR